MFDLSDLLDFCLARGTPFSLVCFAEKSFKFYKIFLYLLDLVDLLDFSDRGQSVALQSARQRTLFVLLLPAKVRKKIEPTK